MVESDWCVVLSLDRHGVRGESFMLLVSGSRLAFPPAQLPQPFFFGVWYPELFDLLVLLGRGLGRRLCLSFVHIAFSLYTCL